MKLELTEPGVYDLPADVYHRDPVKGGSLSSTGARRILPPSCPALFKHYLDNGQKHRTAFDLGHAAHALVLGIGDPIVEIEADSYRTKDAKALRDAAYAEHRTPLLTEEYEQVQAMAAALRAHPFAGKVFAPERGKAEQTMVWRDQRTGVWCRAMLDWMPNPTPGQRLIVVDYKTTVSAEPGSISRSVAKYGYDQQAAFYLDGVRALGLHGNQEPAFVFIFQMKDPPYLITPVQLDPDAHMWGDRLNRKALSTYRQCVTTDTWPGYTDGVISVGLPTWTTRQREDAWLAGEFDTTENAA